MRMIRAKFQFPQESTTKLIQKDLLVRILACPRVYITRICDRSRGALVAAGKA